MFVSKNNSNEPDVFNGPTRSSPGVHIAVGQTRHAVVGTGESHTIPHPTPRYATIKRKEIYDYYYHRRYYTYCYCRRLITISIIRVRV